MIVMGGVLFGCVGTSSGPGGSATSTGPGTPGGSPIGGAATPGQQPTEWGSPTGNCGLVLVAVAKWDGTPSGIYDPSAEEENGQTCATSQGPSQLIFSGSEKPIVHTSQDSEEKATNACGQRLILCRCPMKNQLVEVEGYTDVFATYNDQGLKYQSGTMRIDCTKIPAFPIVLALSSSSNSIPASPSNPEDSSQSLYR